MLIRLLSERQVNMAKLIKHRSIGKIRMELQIMC
nr:MAG TPA: hypothetical protein [Bacteriophage sp.]